GLVMSQKCQQGKSARSGLESSRAPRNYQHFERARAGSHAANGATNEGREIMTATGYSRLAAVIFSLVALLQFVRALAGWPITIAATAVPLLACLGTVLVAGGPCV